MPFLETTAGRLYYTDHRKDDSPFTPTILIHGAGGSRLDWPQQLRRLPEANAITVDLPGHGKSDGPGRDRVDDYAQVIIGLLDGLDLREVFVCGHSMGGAIAQTLALDYSERISGVILVATGAKLTVHPDILNQVIEHQGKVAEVLSQWLWGDGAPEEMRQNGYDQLMKLSPEVIYDDYVACNHFDVRDRLHEIAAPTLIISGTEDKMTFHKYSIYLQEQITHSQLVPIEKGGHMVTLEYPDQVAGAVQGWIDRHQINEDA